MSGETKRRRDSGFRTTLNIKGRAKHQAARAGMKEGNVEMGGSSMGVGGRPRPDQPGAPSAPPPSPAAMPTDPLQSAT